MQTFNTFYRNFINERAVSDTSASNNLFGTIAANSGIGMLPAPGAGFLPIDGKGGIMNLIDPEEGSKPRWLGLSNRSMQFWAYNYCTPLAAVIDRLAEADSNGIVKFVDEKGVPVSNISKIPYLSRIKKLLSRPNPLQTWEEFRIQRKVYCKIFGYCPTFAFKPAGLDNTYTKFLFNLFPLHAIPEYNYDYDMEEIDEDSENSKMIKFWRITILGKPYEIPSENIILFKDGHINSAGTSFTLPTSKMVGLDFHVSNICAAMEADNVLLKKKGPLGIFSFDPKPDLAGWQPLTDLQKKEIQDELSKYGLTLSQFQHIVSKQPLKWLSTSFNVQELMTKETIRQGTDGICDRYGYPAELMSGKNATYENRNSSEKWLYQNNIIPSAQREANEYNHFFSLEDTPYSIMFDYYHLPVLQEDSLKSGQSRNERSESLERDWKAGIITFNEYRTLQELSPVSGGDIYYPEWCKNNNIQIQSK